jgi:hypothetical protein
MSDIPKVVAMALLGITEGYAFGKVGIAFPQAFRDQFEFKSFLLMKLFFSAVGFSMVGQSLFSLVDSKRFNQSRLYSNQEVGFFRAVVGCFTMGVGMYIAGSGPTMMPTQLFSGVGSGPYIVAGALLGGAIYSLLEPFLAPNPIPKAPIEKTSVDGQLRVSYSSVALPMGLALLAATFGLEHIFPHAKDLGRIDASIPGAWLPIFAGAAVGLNQVPLRLMANKGQGGSLSVMQILATISGGFLAPKNKIKKWIDATQVAYVWIGTSLGAYLAVKFSSGSYVAANGYAPLVSLIGAAVMLFGARYANGCTCGHGISGMSELSASSIAAAMSIFAGGIVAGIAKSVLGL